MWFLYKAINGKNLYPLFDTKNEIRVVFTKDGGGKKVDSYDMLREPTQKEFYPAWIKI